MGVLIKVLLFTIGIYLIFKLIFRGLLYYLFGKATKNLNDQIRWQQDEMAQHKQKQQGKVTINYQPKSNKNISKDEGDYVDFEEIK